MNTYTPNGQVQKISDTVWAVPTATGIKYFTPSFDGQGVNGIEPMPLRAGGGGNSTQIPWEVVQKGDFGRYGGTALGFERENMPGPDGITWNTGWFFDTNPGQATYKYDTGGSFLGDVLGNFISGPGVPLGGFFGAGALNSGGLGNFLSSFGQGTAGAAGGAMDMGIGLNDVFGLGDTPWGVNPQSGGGMNYQDLLKQAELENNWGIDVSAPVSQSATTYFPSGFSLPGDWSSISKSLSPSMLSSLLGSTSAGGFSGLGAGLGALLGALGANQKPAGTTTSVQDIPDYLKPYQSMNLASGTANFANAGAGASLLPGAAAQLGKTINGDYLDPNTNPAFQPYVKDLMGQAGANFASLYGKSPDNLNNSAFQENYTRAITNAALPLYNQAYQTERGNQLNAAGTAPGFASNYAGAALAPNLAFKNLYSGAQSTTQPYFTNPMGGALSGALAGGMFGNSLFGGR